MDISRTKFVIRFIISAFVFMFISNVLFGTDVQLLPPSGESLLGTESPVAWKSIGMKIVLPVKIVLMGPILSFDEFLRDDPPPPFVAIAFASYWTVLASVLHLLLTHLGRKNAR